MEIEDASFLLKNHIEKLEYHWSEMNKIMKPLEILTKETLKDYNPKTIRSFIGYENEPALQIYFHNERDMKNANELLTEKGIKTRTINGWGNRYYKYCVDVLL